MGVHGILRSSYLSLKRAATDNPLFDYWWLVEQEVDTWGDWVDLPLRRRLWLWRHGFTSPLGKLYDFEDHGQEAYLSELQKYRLYRALNGRHRYLIDDKLSQHWMLGDYPDHRPTAYGLVDRGHVHGVAGAEFEEGAEPVRDWFPATLRRESALVLKKLRGKAGKEVLVCEYDDGYLIDGDRVSEEELCETVAQLSGYLVSEYVRQHAYADELYPNATNTIRLLTVWDDETGELITPIAVHRIGTERSRPVDNFSAGGLTAEIDFETGTLGRAAKMSFDGDVTWYATHPDSGARIEGAEVSEWERVRSVVDRLAKDNTHIPMIGWDILLDESGEPVVIEANTGCSLDLLQVHRPLLEDGCVARVVSRYLPEVRAPPVRVSHERRKETDGERRAPPTMGRASE